MKKKITLILFLCMSLIGVSARDVERSHEMGTETDVYIEYSPHDKVTLFLGEEFYLSNFLTPNSNIIDASYTSIGANYTPHKNITLTAAYEFQYFNGGEICHRVKLMAIPKVFFGDFTLSLRERLHMTYSMETQDIAWQLRSRLKLDYSIPNTPLVPNVYVELYNPLQKNPESWYSSMSYAVGLDWIITDNHILGIYYDFSHSPDSFYHLLGVAYTLCL